MLARLRPHAAGVRTAAIETAVATGNAAAARTLLDRAEPGEQLSPAMYALVFAAESNGRDGVGEMVEIYRREPTAHHARWMAVALHRAGRLDDLAPMLSSAVVPVDRAVIAEAARAAENLGHPAAAAAVRAVGDA